MYCDLGLGYITYGERGIIYMLYIILILQLHIIDMLSIDGFVSHL